MWTGLRPNHDMYVRVWSACPHEVRARGLMMCRKASRLRITWLHPVRAVSGVGRSGGPSSGTVWKGGGSEKERSANRPSVKRAFVLPMRPAASVDQRGECRWARPRARSSGGWRKERPSRFQKSLSGDACTASKRSMCFAAARTCSCRA
jgi:hypothetical protein